MIIRLLTITLLMVLVSCGGQPKNSVKLKVSNISAAVGDIPGGMILMGHNYSSGQDFSLKLDSGETDIELHNGDWDFFAVTWDGSFMMEGTPECGGTRAILEGGDAVVDITTTNAKCLNPGAIELNFIKPNQFLPINLYSCDAFPVPLLAGSDCVGFEGTTQSVRLKLETWFNSDGVEIKSYLNSECYVVTSGIGSLPLSLPFGGAAFGRFPVELEAYETSDCTGLVERIMLPDGLESNNFHSANNFNKYAKIVDPGVPPVLKMFLDTYIALPSSPDNFVTEWQVPGGDLSITLPLPDLSLTYNFNVDWGDGSQDTITTFNQAETTHTYATAGTYTVVISGMVQGWSFQTVPASKDKLIKVINLGDVGWTNLNGAFLACSNLTVFSGGNTSQVTDMEWMFQNSPLVTPDTSSWDTSLVTNFHSMFSLAASANPDTSAWDTGAGVNFLAMFNNASSANPDTSGWDTSKVTDMRNMFLNAVVANPDVDSWDTYLVTDMSGMFEGAVAATPVATTSGNIWNTLNVVNFANMFSGASLANPDVSGWDVSNAGSFTRMFRDATNATPDTSSWDTSSATELNEMFSGASAANPDTSGWNTSLVTNMERMFFNATSAQPDMSGWDIANVTTMADMFTGTTQSTTSWSNLMIKANTTNNLDPNNMHGGNSLCNAAGIAARTNLTTVRVPVWTVSPCTAAATITAIDSSPGNDGKSVVGTDIDIVVTFDSPVTTTNSTLTLSNGATATYLSGAGTTATYRYTIGGGDTEGGDLNVVAFNEGDSGVETTLPTGSNLADNRAIIIGDPFVSEWQTTAPFETITLPLPDNGLVYNFTIDWGDGNTDTITSYNQTEITHTYSDAGIYTTTVSGQMEGFAFGTYPASKDKLLAVPNLGSVGWKDLTGAFESCTNLALFKGGDTSQVTNMSKMFMGTPLAVLDVSSFVTSNVTDMSFMFAEAWVADPDVSGFDTTNVINMRYMFFNALVANPDVSNFNTTNVTSMASMFAGAAQATPVTTTWDTSKVTNFSSMFSGAALANPDVSGWNTSDATSFSSMFKNATAANPDTSAWVTTSATNMQFMFANATNAQPVMINWDFTLVVDTTSMFANAPQSAMSYSQLLIDAEVANSNPVPLDGGTSKCTLAGQIAGQALITDHTWVITPWPCARVPYITDINAAPALDGIQTAPTVIDIVATFSDNVITTTSNLILNNGATATYQSGSGTAAITYRYTISGGDASTGDLTVTAFNVGDANDGTSFPNMVEAILPIGNNLIDNRDIQVINGNPFIAKWNIPGGDLDLVLPLPTGFTYNFTVDWGDGTKETISGANATSSHVYAIAGTYRTVIEGTIPSFSFNNAGDKDQLTAVLNLGDVGWTNLSNAFAGAINLTTVEGGVTSQVYNMVGMFDGATNANPNTSNWDTSNVNNMNVMFRDTNAANPDVSNWDTSSLIAMAAMFSNATVANPDVSNWNTSTVSNMNSVFTNAVAANPNTASWDTSSVNDMSAMFNGAISAQPDMSGWDISSVTSMNQMFAGTTQPTTSWSKLLVNANTNNFNDPVIMDGGNSKCTAAGVAAKAGLEGRGLPWTVSACTLVTPPTIVGINAAAGLDGANAAAAVIDIVVTFDVAVVTTTSHLVLSNGAIAHYQAGSGSPTLTYRYTVNAGDASTADLNVSSFYHGDALDVDPTMPVASNLADNRAIGVN